MAGREVDSVISTGTTRSGRDVDSLSSASLKNTKLIDEETIVLDADYDPHSDRSGGEGRTWWERTVGKMEHSSQRTAIVTLTVATVGVSFFAFPKAFSCYGYVNGSIIIAYAAVSTMITYSVLASVCAAYPNHSLYSELVKHFLGPFWSRYTSVILILDYLGCCIGYAIVCKTSSSPQSTTSSAKCSAISSRRHSACRTTTSLTRL